MPRPSWIAPTDGELLVVAEGGCRTGRRSAARSPPSRWRRTPALARRRRSGEIVDAPHPCGNPVGAVARGADAPRQLQGAAPIWVLVALGACGREIPPRTIVGKPRRGGARRIDAKPGFPRHPVRHATAPGARSAYRGGVPSSQPTPDPAAAHPLARLWRRMPAYRPRIIAGTVATVSNKLFDIAPEILIGVAIDVVVRGKGSFVAELFGGERSRAAAHRACGHHGGGLGDGIAHGVPEQTASGVSSRRRSSTICGSTPTATCKTLSSRGLSTAPRAVCSRSLATTSTSSSDSSTSARRRSCSPSPTSWRSARCS